MPTSACPGATSPSALEVDRPDHGARDGHCGAGRGPGGPGTGRPERPLGARAGTAGAGAGAPRGVARQRGAGGERAGLQRDPPRPHPDRAVRGAHRLPALRGGAGRQLGHARSLATGARRLRPDVASPWSPPSRRSTASSPCSRPGSSCGSASTTRRGRRPSSASTPCSTCGTTTRPAALAAIPAWVSYRQPIASALRG